MEIVYSDEAKKDIEYWKNHEIKSSRKNSAIN
jgi:hypothetical protein